MGGQIRAAFGCQGFMLEKAKEAEEAKGKGLKARGKGQGARERLTASLRENYFWRIPNLRRLKRLKMLKRLKGPKRQKMQTNKVPGC